MIIYYRFTLYDRNIKCINESVIIMFSYKYETLNAAVWHNEPFWCFYYILLLILKKNLQHVHTKARGGNNEICYSHIIKSSLCLKVAGTSSSARQ